MKHIIFVLMGLILFSCTKDLGTLSSTNNVMKIELSATKVIADPMKVSLKVHRDGKTFDAQFEVFSDELSTETVNFDWRDAEQCVITFQEWDDSPKRVLVGIQHGGLLIKSLDD